jgi:hypothetical protein
MIRSLVHEAAFVVLVTAFVAGLVALLVGALMVAGLCALIAAVADAVGWLTVPNPNTDTIEPATEEEIR